MLPILMYNNMEGSSNSLNNTPNTSFNQYDDSIILNCVRNRKKVTELPSCPVCSCTIRQGELDSHLALEVERLQKLSGSGSKRKLSANSSGNLAVAGSSTSTDVPEEDVDVSGCLGSDVYQRVHQNRLRRLRARRKSSPPPQHGECPVCNTTLPVSRLQRHALRCLKRTGVELDEDVPDTSSEDGSIDVENDEPTGGGFGAEYQWCGEWRVRASALQDGGVGGATCVRRASNDQALVVDGDEDTELYGPPQYSPSRIAPTEPSTDEERRDRRPQSSETREECSSNDKIVPLLSKCNGLGEGGAEVRHFAKEPFCERDVLRPGGILRKRRFAPEPSKYRELKIKNNHGRYPRRIQALKARIKELERNANGAGEMKCLICLEQYTSPTVSIQCWHVYCEECWLQSLRTKKICPQCNAITTAQHLRRIYM